MNVQPALKDTTNCSPDKLPACNWSVEMDGKICLKCACYNGENKIAEDSKVFLFIYLISSNFIMRYKIVRPFYNYH